MKPIIVLDEPTAALDPESKKIVMDAIKNNCWKNRYYYYS